MKLFVDGQLFQTGALERGMGTLAIEVLRAAARQDSNLDISILLNDKMRMTKEHDKRLHTLLDGFKLEYLSLETPATGPEERAKRQIEAYIDAHTSSGERVAYLLPALFLFDYFALFPKNCKTILIFHDLIPLVMWKYLKNVFPGHTYFARFPLVFEADIILANSENTKRELVRLLGLQDENVVVMGGAPETIDLKKKEALERVRALGVSKPYVLLPTGGGHMHHKNNMRAVEALSLVRRSSERDFSVVATSRYEEYERDAMHCYLGEELYFTGNISTADMQALYCCADVVLAPALAEGLGIPLLNAVSQGVPVAASRIPVYTELSDGKPAFYDFDPYDVWEMRDATFAALARVGFTEKQRIYKEILARYTWDNCAKHLVATLHKEVEHHPSMLKRLNVIVPDPIVDTNQGYLAQSLFAASPKHGYELHYYIDPSVNPPLYDDRGADFIRYIAHCYEVGAYDQENNNDVISLLFLSQNADFTRLHLLSRILRNTIVYVSGDVSEHLYDALLNDKIIDDATAEQEKNVQSMLKQHNLFDVPHPFLNARAVIVEERSAKKLKSLLAAMGVNCQVKVVPNNQNEGLNEYVQQENPLNDTILSFITKVVSND